MGRIRTIKPDFWVDDVMADLHPIDRLLYIGLWNFVDDEGYIEYKPRRIKMQVFPGNDYDVDAALLHLLHAGRVAQFDSDQGALLQVLKFGDHQKISHPTPTKFTGIARCNSGNAPESSGKIPPPPESSLRKGKEGKGKDGEVHPAVEHAKDFEIFWKAFPRKQGKQPALKRYLEARKRGVPAGVILAGAEAYARDQAGAERSKVKMAEGWLNSSRWDDDYSEPVLVVATHPAAPRSLAPVVHAHVWVADGTCTRCDARRDREDTW